MNKDWACKCKVALDLLSKKDSFEEGKENLLELRNILFDEIQKIKDECPDDYFYMQPYLKAKGYHNKTLAYSIWHVFRIEDIVCHTLIKEDQQILFKDDWQKKIGTSVITTGNEILGEEISTFSKTLNIKALVDYAEAVKKSTDELIKTIDYETAKIKISAEKRKAVEESNCVSRDENAWWLIDYWCKKNICGLMKMPFSRHWIMHIEAMIRIRNKIEG